MKKLSLIIGNDGLTNTELNKLATDVNLGSVTLYIDDDTVVRLDVSTFNPSVDNGFITFPLYVNPNLEFKEGITEELIREATFSKVSGYLWLEDSPYEIEKCSLCVVDSETKHTSMFNLEIE